jgi:hypothetical protein
MMTESALLSVLPTTVLDMTTDFAPLLMGLVIGLCLSVLGLAFAIGVYDSWWLHRRAPKKISPLARVRACQMPHREELPVH